MSPFHDDGVYAWRSCCWTFGLLMLIGLSACGTSDQRAGANQAATPATAGAAQQESAVPPSGSHTAAQPPTTPPNSISQPATPAIRPRPSVAPAPPRPIKPTAAPAAPTAAGGGISGWQSYHSATAGFSVAYPPDWTASEQSSEDGALITVFTPSGGGPGIKVVVQAGAPPAIRQPETSSRVCERVVAGRLTGTRCRDTKAATISTTLAGEGRTYTIATTGKGVDEQLYQRFLDSFAPAG